MYSYLLSIFKLGLPKRLRLKRNAIWQRGNLINASVLWENECSVGTIPRKKLVPDFLLFSLSIEIGLVASQLSRDEPY